MGQTEKIIAGLEPPALEGLTRAPFPPYHMVGEEGLSTARRTEDELVAVGDDTTLHWQVRNIQVDRLARQAVNHTHTER